MSSHPILPSDHGVRRRFAEEIRLNISLLAPAGSGKTHAISDRVATVACAPAALQMLPRLAAVTYTNKAADELRQRSSMAIRARGVGDAVLGAFEQAFFGTIHSFASHLLREFGHYIGVPAGFDVAPRAEDLWKLFLQATDQGPGGDMRARVLRHISFADLQAAAESCSFGRTLPVVPDGIPPFDPTRLLAYVPKRKQSLPTVARGQQKLRSFAKLWLEGGDGFAEIPEIDQGGAEFIELCEIELAPARKWLRTATAAVAGGLYQDFRLWRVANGQLSYDDQVSLAAELFKHPEAARAIRECGYSVILDEAQDTDPAQFTLLMESARAVDAGGAWDADGATPPEPGRFCMVGDFQQAIYSSRADVSTCRKVHDIITAPGVGEALTFTTTFRCDTGVLSFVNQVGPAMLDGQGKQVSYVPLEARTNAGPGEVLRIPFDAVPDELTADDRLRLEGRRIGQFLRQHGLAGLGINAWNQIAILAPRTAWLKSLSQGLTDEGVAFVTLSQSERNCDRPTFLWTAAIATVLSEQRNTWEIAGVLRELYGISDRDLADFTQGRGDLLRLDRSQHGSGSISKALNELRELRRRTHALPLRDAMEVVDCEFLRPRLNALPVEEYGIFSAEIDRMTAMAAKIETAGGDMTIFAKHLRDHLYDKPEAVGENPSAVSLLTNHKSKGLEWPVVILPTLFRDFTFEKPSYPRVIGEAGTALDIAFRKEEAATHDLAAHSRIRDELGRLAYVSLTRAKRLLVLCYDRALWSGEDIGELTLAKAMRFSKENDLIASLGTERVATLHPDAQVDLSPAASFEFDMAEACEQARNSPQKITPHRLVKDNDREGLEARIDESLPAVPFSATQYGTWWHETMRLMPWRKAESWAEHFEAAIMTSPNIERARREWGLFVESSMAKQLARAEIVRTECPFLIPLDGDALEGVIDLVFKEGGKWFVLDWKTTQSHQLESALGDYGPQLRPYRDVVAGMLATKVTAIIYLTATGEAGLVN